MPLLSLDCGNFDTGKYLGVRVWAMLGVDARRLRSHWCRLVEVHAMKKKKRQHITLLISLSGSRTQLSRRRRIYNDDKHVYGPREVL
jgi:hypothetical protein